MTGLIEFIFLGLKSGYTSSDDESSAVFGFIADVLGFGLMFPVLYFVRVDTRPCNDSTITTAFWLTVAVFVSSSAQKGIGEVNTFLSSLYGDNRDFDPDEPRNI